MGGARKRKDPARRGSLFFAAIAVLSAAVLVFMARRAIDLWNVHAPGIYTDYSTKADMWIDLGCNEKEKRDIMQRNCTTLDRFYHGTPAWEVLMRIVESADPCTNNAFVCSVLPRLFAIGVFAIALHAASLRIYRSVRPGAHTDTLADAIMSLVVARNSTAASETAADYLMSSASAEAACAKGT